MPKGTRIAAWLAASLALWMLLGLLIVVEDAGVLGALSLPRLLATVLLLAAPAVTFVPLARWARAPLYDVEAVLGWVTFGFMLAFVSPSIPPTLAEFLVFLISLTVALATLLAPVAYLVGLRLSYRGRGRVDIVRARRQGYLAAFCLVALLLLYSVETLTPTSALLLLVIAGLVEMLALSLWGDDGASRPARRATSDRGF